MSKLHGEPSEWATKLLASTPIRHVCLTCHGECTQLAAARARIAELEKTNAQLDRSDKASAENGLTLALELDRANQRIAELEAASQWRPIAEAPKDGRWLPLLRTDGQWLKGRWWTGMLGFSCWVDADMRIVDRSTITHFMPAPPAPEPKEAL